MSGIYGADGYRYDPWSQSRVHETDYNQDGRSDLVFWNDEHFGVHTQDVHGLFAAVGKTFQTEVAFDTDQIYSLASGDMTGRALHSLTDLNGDGVGDLVVFSLQGQENLQKTIQIRGAFWRPDLRGRHRVRLGGRGHVQVGGPHPARDGPAHPRPRRPGPADVHNHRGEVSQQ